MRFERFDDVCGENVDTFLEAPFVGLWQVFVPKMAANGSHGSPGTVFKRQ